MASSTQIPALFLGSLEQSEPGTVYLNPTVPDFVAENVTRDEGMGGLDLAVMVDNGGHTGYSPKGKFAGPATSVPDSIRWGNVGAIMPGLFGTGTRMPIKATRGLPAAALSGVLDKGKFRKDAIFGFEVPLHDGGVGTALLDPGSTWARPVDYDQQARTLVKMFADKFRQYLPGIDPEFRAVTCGWPPPIRKRIPVMHGLSA